MKRHSIDDYSFFPPINYFLEDMKMCSQTFVFKVSYFHTHQRKLPKLKIFNLKPVKNVFISSFKFENLPVMQSMTNPIEDGGFIK